MTLSSARQLSASGVKSWTCRARGDARHSRPDSDARHPEPFTGIGCLRISPAHAGARHCWPNSFYGRIGFTDISPARFYRTDPRPGIRRAEVHPRRAALRPQLRPARVPLADLAPSGGGGGGAVWTRPTKPPVCCYSLRKLPQEMLGTSVVLVGKAFRALYMKHGAWARVTVGRCSAPGAPKPCDGRGRGARLAAVRGLDDGVRGWRRLVRGERRRAVTG